MYTYEKLMSAIEHYRSKMPKDVSSAVLILTTNTGRHLKFPVEFTNLPNYGLDIITKDGGKESVLAYKVSDGNYLYITFSNIVEVCIRKPSDGNLLTEKLY